LRLVLVRVRAWCVSADQSFDGSLYLKSREGKVYFWVVGHAERSRSSGNLRESASRFG